MKYWGKAARGSADLRAASVFWCKHCDFKLLGLKWRVFYDILKGNCEKNNLSAVNGKSKRKRANQGVAS